MKKKEDRLEKAMAEVMVSAFRFNLDHIPSKKICW
jgi:hypothetical protein